MSKPILNILILAHPGHELRIHHWIELHKPVVYLLTDGSGGKMSSRTHYSKDVIDRAGALSGAVFGEISDKDWYDSILNHRSELFLNVINTIVDDIPADRRVQIISDAVDGYNPMHDIAWAFGQSIHDRLARRNAVLPNLCSAAIPNVDGKLEVNLQLDSDARERKVAAVRGYTPLADEAKRVLEQDPTAFDHETLISQSFDWQRDHSPQWEIIGKDRVASGLYTDCITYNGHVRPMLKLLFNADGLT